MKKGKYIINHDRRIVIIKEKIMHDFKKASKKALTYAVVTTTMVWASGFAAILPAIGATIVDGDLVKTADSSAVYLIQGSTKRVFPHYNVYLSQGYPADFSTVKTVTSSDLASYTDGSAVPFRDGSLFRGTSAGLQGKDKTAVFAVSDGKLRPVKSEAIYQALYNDANWNYVTWVPDDLLSKFDYGLGTDVETSAVKPNGSIIKYAGSGALYLIADGQKRAFTSWDAYIANRFDKSNKIIPILTATEAYSDGSNITGVESALVTPGAGASSTVAVGGLTVALAANTPAAGNAVANAQRTNFTKVNLSANGGNVTIDQMTVKRGGLSLDSDFSEIIVTDEAGNLLDTEKTLNSEHTVVFTKDITVTSGTTKAIYLAANMAATVTAGNSATLSLTEIVTKDSAAVTASLPITGNPLTMATATIGTITVQTSGASSNPSAATKKVGTTDYIFTSLKVSPNSTEDVQIESIRFNQASTASDSDITNIELLVDSIKVADGTLKDKEVIFDLSASPVKINKGTNKEVSIRGDIVSGTDRTISFGFSKKTDVKVKGLLYGFYLSPTYDSTTTNYYVVGPICTIGIGSLTITKATISSLNVAPGAVEVELSAFNMQALGEPIIISRISFDVATYSSAIDNVKVYDANGVRVAGPMSPSSTGSYATSTDTFTVPVGTTKYTIKGDLKTTVGWLANESLAIKLNGNYITAKGDVTNQTVTPSPATQLALDTLTVKTGTVTVRTSTTPPAGSVVIGTNNYTFANFTFDTTASGEDVNLSQLTIKHTTTAAGRFGDIQNIILYDGSTALNAAVQGSDETADSSYTSTATTTITLTNTLKIAKGTVKTLTLKGNISGSASAAGHRFGIVRAGNVTVKGAATGLTITPTIVASDGQTQTVTTAGTLDVYNAAANPGNSVLVGNTTGNTVQQLSVVAKYEDIQINNLGLTIGGDSNSYQQISQIVVSDGTKTWTTSVSSANATISPTSGDPLVIPAGTTRTLTIKADTNSVGYGLTGTSGDKFTITISNIDEKGVSSGSTSLTITGNNTASNSMFVFATKPTVTKVSLGSTLSLGNSKELYKFTVAADAKGDLGLYKATFDITTSSATVTNFRWSQIDGGTETDLAYQESTWAGLGTTSGDQMEIITASSGGTGGTYRLNAFINTESNAFPGYEYIQVPASGSRTYVLKGDITRLSGVTGSSISIAMIGDNAEVSVSSAGMKLDKETDRGAGGIQSNASNAFIWSDLNYGLNSTTATITAQWSNGYLIVTTSTQSFSF